MLVTSVQNNLKEIIDLLHQLTDEQFSFKHNELSNASIGEHTRHIIELYQCLIENYSKTIINYDLRDRNPIIQTQTAEAIKAIETILNKVDKENKSLKIEQGKDECLLSIETNYFRELLYNLEHSIHHQALIKVAILKFPQIKISDNFGVARSTIEYRLQCAQ